MKRFFVAYRGKSKLSPLLRELPWSSHLRILTIEKEAKGFPDRRLKADAGR